MALPTDEREITLQKTERAYVRLSLGIILGLVLLITICWAGRRLYVVWQERKLMHQAHVAYNKLDLRWAAMAAQRAFSLDDKSLDACRTLADIAEKQKSVQAIEWRRRALAIDPTSFPDRLSLANTALRFSQPTIAAEALAQIAPSQQNNPEYHAAAARVALTQNDLAVAGAHFRAAVRFAPNDPKHALELAEFQLRSGNADERATGRASATRVKSNKLVQLDALHILLNDALARRSDADAVALAQELDALPDAPATDRLLALGILRRFNAPTFTGALTQLESESAGSAEKAARLINWMTSQGLALLGIDWSKQLVPEMTGSVSVRFALADAYIQLRDWTALKAMLQGGSWSGVESFRLALQAKVAQETDDSDDFEKFWAEAVAQAENNSDRLNVLQKLAFQWRWPAKGVGVLWLLAQIPDSQTTALQALYNYFAAERDTAGLFRVLTRLIDVLPDDPMVKNNYAQISLLLHADPFRARTLAGYVHREQPKNAAFASTYAFALYRDGDLVGALKVMETLTPEQLEDPSVAAYYGIFLTAAGHSAEAVKFLDASGLAKLLPEEEKLVSQARTSLARQKSKNGGA
jgi:predicted Zn-dependent protease